jgi:uncharacterized protein (TIGR02145 family)
MKTLFFFFLFVLNINLILAQNKTLTVYYGIDSTRVINLTNSDSLVIFICGASKVNYGGKYYNTVLIGNQCWMKKNLDVGTMIQGNTNQSNNGVIEKYCYNNDTANCNIYGGFYQWDEMMQYVTTEGAQGICPDGWHIPTLAEFQTLSSTVGGNSNALKAIGQGGGTNTSGFSALIAGFRNYTGGNFTALGSHGRFWSSSEFDTANAYDLILLSNDGSINLHSNYKDYGFSVRCIKD